MNKYKKYILKYRNAVFFSVCFLVHFFYMIFFLCVDVKFAGITNACSCAFYMLLLFFNYKKSSERLVIFAYFEINIYATIATVMLGFNSGFIFYIFGMISIIFYLANFEGLRKYIYQAIGAIDIILLYIFKDYFDSMEFSLRISIDKYDNALNFINVCITIFTLIGISFFYSTDIKELIHKLKDTNEELQFYSTYDGLTGLKNRRVMQDYLNELELSDQEVIVCMGDIDDFKVINDKNGHAFGDKVLIEITSIMGETLKNFETCRWGGEEFLFVLNNLNEDEAYKLIYDLKNKISNLSFDKEGFERVTMTFGITKGNSKDIDRLVIDADNLLYYGKEHGKNLIVKTDNKKQFN